MSKKQNKRVVLSHDQVRTLIKNRNKVFKAASAAEKRVLIAKDVLEQLKNKTIHAQTQAFVEFIDENGKYSLLHFDGKDSLREKFLKNEVEYCACCGIGALAVSCVLFNNGVKINQATTQLSDLGLGIIADRKFTHGLTEYFSREQLELIECAFEEGYGFFSYKSATTSCGERERASTFGKRYISDRGRLEGIMKNIIHNEGEFIP